MTPAPARTPAFALKMDANPGMEGRAGAAGEGRKPHITKAERRQQRKRRLLDEVSCASDNASRACAWGKTENRYVFCAGGVRSAAAEWVRSVLFARSSGVLRTMCVIFGPAGGSVTLIG